MIQRGGGSGVLTVNDSVVEGGLAGTTVDSGSTIDGGGNTADDPGFAVRATGTWTVDGDYDSMTGQTLLTDTSATWNAGEMIGLLLNPNTNQRLQFYVVTNSATTATVWGDASLPGTNAAAYRFCDFHLKSPSIVPRASLFRFL